MKDMELKGVLVENELRKSARKGVYDPLLGIGSCGDRVELSIADYRYPVVCVPVEMLDVPLVAGLAKYGSFREYILQDLCCGERLSREEYWAVYDKTEIVLTNIRTGFDFEYWAILIGRIKNKEGGDDIPFRLNSPQRKLLGVLEGMRLGGVPIRVILLKARQWGGSTLVQMYMAWIQLCHKRGWNSTIAAHVKDSARNVKGMYEKLINYYPSFVFGRPLSFSPFLGSANTSYIEDINCKVTIGSAEAPDSLRGEDTAMAHLTEVAFWRKTENKTPEELVRSVSGGIMYAPYTVIVYESTANGTGNYFHKEWLRAKDGTSNNAPVFVAWFEIELYERSVDDYGSLVSRMSDYHWELWGKGATLENIAWYMAKSAEYDDAADMMAEYPSDDVEAFKHSGRIVFNSYAVERLRQGCYKPEFVGELHGGVNGRDAACHVCTGGVDGLRFVADDKGCLKVWEKPRVEGVVNRYLVVVDAGKGRSEKSDYSVIVVLDRYWLMDGGCEEVVAEWKGRIDLDLLGWKAMQVAKWYGDALLVIESNTFETKEYGDDTYAVILNEIADVYGNLYYRSDPEKIRQGLPVRYGFHTNVSTKSVMVITMISVVRECLYVEKSVECCNEMDVYEKRVNGSYGAKDGYHDDALMTRMIGLVVSLDMDLPRRVVKGSVRNREVVGVASI